MSNIKDLLKKRQGNSTGTIQELVLDTVKEIVGKFFDKFKNAAPFSLTETGLPSSM